MPAPTSDEMKERRRQYFAVRAEAARHPEFEDEKTIFVTYNGRQEQPVSLAPHEAKLLVDLLCAEFGL